jgi:hypothetical protein
VSVQREVVWRRYDENSKLGIGMRLDKPICKYSSRGRRETLRREPQTADLGGDWTGLYVNTPREVVGRPYDENNILRIWDVFGQSKM